MPPKGGEWARGRVGDEAFSYDLVPYTSYPYPRTHPDRLATVGRLFGMEPAPVERCRVLELGCASGGNLIPMAEQLPGSELLGVDLGQRQVAEGRAVIEALGLRNVELRHGDLCEVDQSWGSFDYVICHGVYSWVPEAVKREILRIFAERLRPQGIGYVSYNTYPGWHLRDAVRHMMRYHAKQFDEPGKRTEQAGALVDFLARAVDPEGAYGQLLQRELQLVQRTGPDYLFHEHLEEVNTPLYFHQLVERAHGQGLQYLGDAEVHTMLTDGLPPEVAQTLARISPDLISLEQYLDFVHNRQFRGTLLCHEGVELQRALGPAHLHGGWLGFSGQAEGTVELRAEVMVSFRAGETLEVETALPMTKAALVLLRRAWPDLVRFEELVAQAKAMLHEHGVEVAADDEALAHALGADLLALHCRGAVELHRFRPALCTTVSERPRVGAHARLLAARGAGFVVSARHARVELSSLAALVVQRLDGEWDREALVEVMVEAVLDGTVDVGPEVLALGREGLVAPLGETLDRTLSALADAGVLVG